MEQGKAVEAQRPFIPNQPALGPAQRPDPGVDPPAHAVVLSIDEKSQI